MSVCTPNTGRECSAASLGSGDAIAATARRAAQAGRFRRVGMRGSMSDNPHARALVEGALVVPLPDRMSLGMQAGIAGVVFMSWIMRADVARGLRGGREGGGRCGAEAAIEGSNGARGHGSLFLDGLIAGPSAPTVVLWDPHGASPCPEALVIGTQRSRFRQDHEGPDTPRISPVMTHFSASQFQTNRTTRIC